MKGNKLKDNVKKKLIKEVINEEGFDIPIYIIVLQDNGDAYDELCRISNLEKVYLDIKDRLLWVHNEKYL